MHWPSYSNVPGVTPERAVSPQAHPPTLGATTPRAAPYRTFDAAATRHRDQIKIQFTIALAGYSGPHRSHEQERPVAAAIAPRSTPRDVRVARSPTDHRPPALRDFGLFEIGPHLGLAEED
jgi:hypothetical protein